MPKRTQRLLSLMLAAAAVLGGGWFALRCLLPWLSPFLLALALASLLEPLVRALTVRGLRRSAAAGFLTLLLAAALLWGLWELLSRGAAAAGELARQVPALASRLGLGFSSLEQRLLRGIDSAPPELSDYLREALDTAARSLTALPARLSQAALDLLASLAQRGPDVLLFAVTAGIGTYFLSASYPRVLAFLSAQLPREKQLRLRELGQDLKGSFGGFLRAQLILMVMTFFELLPAFLLMKIRAAMALAAVTALVDALPVFGTGTVLLPWAAVCLLSGDSGRALGLVLCWLLVNLVRNCVQAKLLGDQIGLDPLASLIAIYVGWRIGRVWGMLLAPLLLVTLQQLNERGVIRLWKNT